MELWEFNACVYAYNDRQKQKGNELITLAWHTANFQRAKRMKNLSEYIKSDDKKLAPQVNKSEFEKRLAQAERRGNGT